MKLQNICQTVRYFHVLKFSDLLNGSSFSFSAFYALSFGPSISFCNFMSGIFSQSVNFHSGCHGTRDERNFDVEIGDGETAGGGVSVRHVFDGRTGRGRSTSSVGQTAAAAGQLIVAAENASTN